MTSTDRKPSVNARTAEAMRDRMTHRGPDDAGLWAHENVILAHRRLSVIDTSDAGHQPMVSPDGRRALVYNGELYNDAELRAQLEAEGARFGTSCDTETVLWALSMWGLSAIERFRGMYAMGFVDLDARTLLLARDPLGIKPLYWARLGSEVVFASEIPAILAHPAARRAPDWETVSAYLTTIRITLDDRTMFEGVRTLRPGEQVVVDLGDESLPCESRQVGIGRTESGDVRASVTESVEAHLRSDVPLCSLLSGGLDSSICAHVAKQGVPDLRTFCAGAKGQTAIGGVPQSEDFEFARRVASELGTDHAEASVDAALFHERWSWMVGRLGVPLSTPNEVAIYEVARTLRDTGCVVTLSGEGADELFGGYEAPLKMAAEMLAGGATGPAVALTIGAWVPIAEKANLCAPDLLERAQRDDRLIEWVCAQHEQACAYGADPLAAQLGVQRRINLAGLLARLDTSTMLASVEGRTPLADVRVTALAENLPMDRRYGGEGRTKVALREAFAEDLPADVVARPKASFPLPFQDWVGQKSETIRGSVFLRSVLAEPVIEAVASQPQQLWSLAWPAANLAMWGDRL